MRYTVSIDGELVAPKDAKISVFDRGFLYGDSVFEVYRTYAGKPFREREHLERLARSAARIFIDLPIELDRFAHEIRATLDASGLKDAYVRVIVTRGSGPIVLDPSTAESPTRVVIVAPVTPPDPSSYDAGIAVVTVRHARPTDVSAAAGAKASNYLANLLAQREARAKNAHEAIFVAPNGDLLEGATSNLFVFREGVLMTPSLDLGILGGITRAMVMKAAEREGIVCVEGRIPRESLEDAEEVFITSSIRELMPVIRVDDVTIGRGVPGPNTKRLHRAYRTLIEEEIERA
jgi:branched-chain amino acid aminotransferase